MLAMERSETCLIGGAEFVIVVCQNTKIPQQMAGYAMSRGGRVEGCDVPNVSVMVDECGLRLYRDGQLAGARQRSNKVRQGFPMVEPARIPCDVQGITCECVGDLTEAAHHSAGCQGEALGRYDCA